MSVLKGLAVWFAQAAALLLVSSCAMNVQVKDREWKVRDWEGMPGNGCWNPSADSVRVDGDGLIHLRVAPVNGRWCQAEIISLDVARYGRHRFHVISRLDQLHPSVVLGMFLYRDDQREIDIEISRDFGGEDDVGLYVVQPGREGRFHSFPIELSGDYTTHEIEWREGAVRFASWHGHCEEGPCGGWIERWEYHGPGIPVEADELKVIMNLWLRDGPLPDEPQEAVLRYSGPL